LSHKETNYWPISIGVIIAVVVVLIIFTVNFAITNSVHEENAFLKKYQDVDANFDKYNTQKNLFLSNYNPRLVNEKLVVGKNSLELILEPNEGYRSDDLNISFYLTRPISNKEDLDINLSSKNGNTFLSDEFVIDKEGRWRVYIKAQTPNSDIPAVIYFDINGSKE